MKASPEHSKSSLAALVKTEPEQRVRRRRRLVVAAVLIVIAGALWFFLKPAAGGNGRGPTFVTEPVRRSDIVMTITATGSLEPTNQITVSSELSGTIQTVHVDINDRVTKGQPLAQLDTSKLEQQLTMSRAALGSAEAAVKRAEATLAEAKATLKRQEELHALSEGRTPSKAELEATRAAASRAEADLLAAQAQLAEVQAQVAIDETNLAKAVIRSPVDGIVLTRSVDPGQTVAASFNAPELFIIAEDLERMKLIIQVAEADIGRVQPGLEATFSVDAWPDRTYTATVRRVAFGSTVTNNVVTYETELEVENRDLSLRPGMTATTDIRVAESRDVLTVPVAALRFDPGREAPAATGERRSFVQSIIPMPPHRASSSRAEEPAEKHPSDAARVWVLRDGRPQPVEIRKGLSDARRVEVLGSDLKEGDAVILRMQNKTP